MKSKKTSRKAKKVYDTKMIEDFLDHLLWELRTSHFEQTQPGAHNPELTEQLAKYMRKYGAVGFSPYTFLDHEEGVAEEDYRRVQRVLLERTRLLRERELHALEEARPHILRALEVLQGFQEANRRRNPPPMERLLPSAILREDLMGEDDADDLDGFNGVSREP